MHFYDWYFKWSGWIAVVGRSALALFLGSFTWIPILIFCILVIIKIDGSNMSWIHVVIPLLIQMSLLILITGTTAIIALLSDPVEPIEKLKRDVIRRDSLTPKSPSLTKLPLPRIFSNSAKFYTSPSKSDKD